MFLTEPPPTAYDFRFQFLGFPVRVTPFFWVAAVLIGWNWADGWHRLSVQISEMQRAAIESQNWESEARQEPPTVIEPVNQGVLLLIWVSALFVSILVHEMGHGLALRYYGTDASWDRIYRANQAKLRDPDTVPLGTVLVLPEP